MITYTNRLDKAMRIAAWAHEQEGQHRKGGDIPYIIHPVGVMMIASSATDDEDVLIACLMHDVLEDVNPGIYSEADMRTDFGERVVAIVHGVTNDGTEKDWRKRSELYLAHLQNEASSESVIVSVADKTHNLMATLVDYETVGSELWQLFTTKSSADQLWWYESILGVVTSRQAPEALVSKLSDLVDDLRVIA